MKTNFVTLTRLSDWETGMIEGELARDNYTWEGGLRWRLLYCEHLPTFLIFILN